MKYASILCFEFDGRICSLWALRSMSSSIFLLFKYDSEEKPFALRLDTEW